MRTPNIDPEARTPFINQLDPTWYMPISQTTACISEKPGSVLTLKLPSRKQSLSKVTCPQRGSKWWRLHSDLLVLSLPCLFPRTLSGIFLLQRASSRHLIFIECLLCAGNCSKPVMSLPSCSETRLQKASYESLKVWKFYAVHPRPHPWRQSIFLTKWFAPLPPVTSLKKSGLFSFFLPS